jgi:hypothetical protein
LEDIKNAMKGYLKPGQTLTVEQKVTFSPAWSTTVCPICIIASHILLDCLLACLLSLYIGSDVHCRCLLHLHSIWLHQLMLIWKTSVLCSLYPIFTTLSFLAGSIRISLLPESYFSSTHIEALSRICRVWTDISLDSDVL